MRNDIATLRTFGDAKWHRYIAIQRSTMWNNIAKLHRPFANLRRCKMASLRCNSTLHNANWHRDFAIARSTMPKDITTLRVWLHGGDSSIHIRKKSAPNWYRIYVKLNRYDWLTDWLTDWLSISFRNYIDIKKILANIFLHDCLSFTRTMGLPPKKSTAVKPRAGGQGGYKSM